MKISEVIEGKNKGGHFLLNGPIAHRGLFDNKRPENSLSAFRYAAAKGLVSELDVQLTSDKQMVVFHDANLFRMTGQQGFVADYTLSQLKKLRLQGTNETIPSLQEVVQELSDAPGFLVEIKSGSQMALASRLVWQIMQTAPWPWAVESFNPLPLLWFKRHAATIWRGMLLTEPKPKQKWQALLLDPHLLQMVVQPDFWAFNLKMLPNPMAQNLRQKGAMILSWTIKNVQDWHKALCYSDNVIFDTIKLY